MCVAFNHYTYVKMRTSSRKEILMDSMFSVCQLFSVYRIILNSLILLKLVIKQRIKITTVIQMWWDLTEGVRTTGSSDRWPLTSMWSSIAATPPPQTVVWAPPRGPTPATDLRRAVADKVNLWWTAITSSALGTITNVGFVARGRRR
jgi:hypothetical protein